MNTKLIIQARMGSKRYPGKSMYLFKDSPSLTYLIDSLLQFYEKSNIIIATSELPENDLIRDFCLANNLNVYSGDEINVAQRFYNILKDRNSDYFIRISGDSPLFDYRLLKENIQLLKDGYDIISTAYTNRNPAGMNFEIIKTDIFLTKYKNFSDSDHFEHVTKYFYENDKEFNIYQIKPKIKNANSYRFAFDTEEDRLRIIKFLNYIDKPHYFYTFEEKCNIYNSL